MTPEEQKHEELREKVRGLLIKTFAQTVEYGGMCGDCCSASEGDSRDGVWCEMSDKPLQPDDYCCQQLACIDSLLPNLLSLIASSLTPISEEQKEATRLEFIRLQNEWHKNLPYEKGKAPSYPDYGTMIRDAQLAHTRRLLGEEK